MSNTVDFGMQGGGLYSDDSGNLVLGNSIVAHNSGPQTDDGPDIYGTVQSADYNLINSIGGTELSGTTTHHVAPGIDPALGPLGDNGGATQTHALGAGSPAIDAGSCEDTEGVPVASDQRGRIRPQGASCDIGSYEYPGPHLLIQKSTESALVKAGEVITYSLIVRNLGDGVAEGGTVSDTLPSGLTLARQVGLSPPSAGTLGPLPAVVTGLTVSGGTRVTVSLPVTVEAGLEPGRTIANVATVTDWGGTGPSSDSDIVVVTTETHTLFIPLVLRASSQSSSGTD